MPDSDDVRHVPKPYTANAVDMLAATQRVHTTLSQMGDQKASILMGATFVIFTITIGQSKDHAPSLPLLLLGGAAFFAAVLAVLSILPAIHSRHSGPLNLLFFGSFTRLEEEEYIDRLCEQLKDDDRIVATFARDIYQNGRVLEFKKYRLLGYAYRVFLIGLTASFIAFVAQFASHDFRVGPPAAVTLKR